MSYSSHEDVEQLGVLYDAQLVNVDGEFLYLSGFEREPMMQRDVIQSWMLRPISREAATQAGPPAGSPPSASAR
ncbi:MULTISPECIES: hypothetical protein [Cupriavidus]